MSPNASAQEPAPAGEDAYSAQDIVVHTGVECVRKRPGMYIGSCDARGVACLLDYLMRLFFEQAQARSSPSIEVELLPGEGFRIADDGDWLSMEPSRPDGKSWVELLFTTFGAGAGHGYILPVVNALAADLLVELHCNGTCWKQEYSRGRPCAPLQPLRQSTHTGTQITFWSDPLIFKGGCELSSDHLANRLRELAALQRKAEVRFINRRVSPAQAHVYRCPDGLADHVRFLNRGCLPVHPSVITAREEGPSPVEMALQWTAAGGSRLWCFVNSEPVLNGTPWEGFRRGLSLAWRQCLWGAGLLPRKGAPLNWEDCSAGLTAVLALEIEEPWFAGATKEVLRNPEAVSLVQRPLQRALDAFFQEHPDEARSIATRILAAREARRNGRKE
jgi:DNA gyrase subunit B